MLKKTILAALLFALALPALHAQPPEDMDGPGPRPEMAERMLKKMQKDLDLTEEQSTKIKAVHDNYRAKHQALREKIDPLHKQLMQTMMSDSPNRAQFESLLRKLSDLRIEARLVEFDQRQETMAVLTPEQRTKWKQIMEKHRKKFKEAREDRRERPDRD